VASPEYRTPGVRSAATAAEFGAGPDGGPGRTGAAATAGGAPEGGVVGPFEAGAACAVTAVMVTAPAARNAATAARVVKFIGNLAYRPYRERPANPLMNSDGIPTFFDAPRTAGDKPENRPATTAHSVKKTSSTISRTTAHPEFGRDCETTFPAERHGPC
jgi:hypothetical protein